MAEFDSLRQSANTLVEQSVSHGVESQKDASQSFLSDALRLFNSPGDSNVARVSSEDTITDTSGATRHLRHLDPVEFVKALKDPTTLVLTSEDIYADGLRSVEIHDFRSGQEVITDKTVYPNGLKRIDTETRDLNGRPTTTFTFPEANGVENSLTYAACKWELNSGPEYSRYALQKVQRTQPGKPTISVETSIPPKECDH